MGRGCADANRDVGYSYYTVCIPNEIEFDSVCSFVYVMQLCSQHQAPFNLYAVIKNGNKCLNATHYGLSPPIYCYFINSRNVI